MEGISEAAHVEVKRLLSFLSIATGDQTLQADWSLLRKEWREREIGELPSLSGGNHDLQLFQALFGICPRVLIKDGQQITVYHPEDYIYTANDLRWASYPLSFPFPNDPSLGPNVADRLKPILNQLSPLTSKLPLTSACLAEDQVVMQQLLASAEADALAAYFLALPYLVQEGTIHEVGCASGRNLFNLLLYGHLQGDLKISAAIGSDINHAYLKSGEVASKMLGLDQGVKFYFANAADSFPLDQLGYDSSNPILKVALRLLPVLNLKSAKLFLNMTREAMRNPESACILSYALPRGRRWENSLLEHKRGVLSIESFGEGITAFKEKPFPGTDVSFLPEAERDVLPNC